MFSRISLIRCKLHPATAIVLWLFFVVWLEFVQPVMLIVAALGLMPWLRGVTLNQFLRYLRRTRWLLLTLLMIYAYTLPGENISAVLGSFSPSVQGLQYGILRLVRLILLLAALSILMIHTPRNDLLLGLFRILCPLQLLGVDAERIAVRLWLTLHYAEAALADTRTINMKQRLEALQLNTAMPTEAPSHIELQDQAMGWTDYLSLILALAVGLVTLW
ncbi:MAG: CbiQ family ECF transporter T component [Pseudomonadota bacterium]